jgi:hypothetical protein
MNARLTKLERREQPERQETPEKYQLSLRHILA